MNDKRPWTEVQEKERTIALVRSLLDQDRARIKDCIGEDPALANAIYMFLGEDPTTIIQTLSEGNEEVTRLVADLARILILDLYMETQRPYDLDED